MPRRELNPTINVVPLEISQPSAKREHYVGMYELILNDQTRVVFVDTSTADSSDPDRQKALQHILNSPLYQCVVVVENTDLPTSDTAIEGKRVIYLKPEVLHQLSQELQVIADEVPYIHSTVLLSAWTQRAKTFHQFVEEQLNDLI